MTLFVFEEKPGRASSGPSATATMVLSCSCCWTCAVVTNNVSLTAVHEHRVTNESSAGCALQGTSCESYELHSVMAVQVTPAGSHHVD
jgi:hypothetical protein